MLSETLVIVGVALTILVALRFRDAPSMRRAIGLGAMCGVLTLVRAEQVLLLGLLVVPLAVSAGDASTRRRLEWAGGAIGVGLLVIAPWAVYNLTRYEEPVLLTTNFGGAIAIANCHQVYQGPRIGFWNKDCYRTESIIGVRSASVIPGTLARRGEDGSTLDAARRDRGLDYVRAHRRDLPKVVLAREGRTWGVFRPFQQLRLDLVRGDIWPLQAGLLSYWVIAALAIGGAVILRHRRLTLWVLATFIVVVVVSTAITFGQTRYRVPADVSLVLLAAVAADQLFARSRNDSTSEAPKPPPRRRGGRRSRIPSVYGSTGR